MSTATSTDGHSRGLRLVVVPSDPISAYEQKGRGALLREYYNPLGFFDEVFALGPEERGRREAHGMTILGVADRDVGRCLRELRPHVVRAYGGGQAADLCARRRVGRIPLVASVHDPDPRQISPALRFVDRVFCVSEEVARRVREVGVDPSRVRLLPNRIDTDVFRPVDDPRAREQLERRFPPGRHILLVGRASPEKNRDTLIRALARLPLDYQLIAIGRGDLAADRALARSEGVSQRVHLVESVPNHELPHWYAWADCVCNPSRWEGFGIVFVEAAACGAAIVASDIPVTRSLLADGSQALLVPELEDPQAIASAVRRVCEDEELAARLRRHAPAAAAPFAKRLVDQREVGLYRELIGCGEPSFTRRLEIASWQAWHRGPLRRARRRLRTALGHPRRGIASPTGG